MDVRLIKMAFHLGYEHGMSKIGQAFPGIASREDFEQLVEEEKKRRRRKKLALALGIPAALAAAGGLGYAGYRLFGKGKSKGKADQAAPAPAPAISPLTVIPKELRIVPASSLEPSAKPTSAKAPPPPAPAQESEDERLTREIGESRAQRAELERKNQEDRRKKRQKNEAAKKTEGLRQTAARQAALLLIEHAGRYPQLHGHTRSGAASRGARIEGLRKKEQSARDKARREQHAGDEERTINQYGMLF